MSESDEASGRTLHDELRAKGYRLTPQRQLVLEAVGQIGHATPEQVLAAVQRKAIGVNISTVYRTLYLLEELGLVRHTHLSHGASTFSLVSETEHVHVVCRDCADVQELAADVVGDLASRLLEEQGFRLDIGHAALFGTCAACAVKAAAGGPPPDLGTPPGTVPSRRARW